MTRFSSRRGRPRQERPSIDMGTPELILKRALDETAEPIDLCLQRRIITPSHHWCGLHLRWLYTLRYGAPGVSAMDLARIDGLDASDDSPLWRSAREAEFAEAVQQLRAIGREGCVMQLCVFNERPAFLRRDLTARAFSRPQLALQIERDILQLREGLDILVRLWKKPTPRSDSGSYHRTDEPNASDVQPGD